MESPISISSPNFHNGDSFVYEADESEPESPSEFQSSVSSLKDKFYLNSYVLIGSHGNILVRQYLLHDTSAHTVQINSLKYFRMEPRKTKEPHPLEIPLDLEAKVRLILLPAL